MDDKIHLNWIDHIKTEFFFLIFIVFSVLILVLSFSAASYEWDIPGMLVVVGVISFIYDGMFQIFYTSVIRRMKVLGIQLYQLGICQHFAGTWNMESIGACHCYLCI